MKNKLFRGIALSIVFILIALNIGTIRVLAAPDEETKEEATEDKLIANPEDSYEVIHISTAEDLITLSENCRVDTWSADKKIVLDQDINVSGNEFHTIPIFCGVFEGNNHTINGFNYGGDGYVTGFFRYIANGAVVRNLNLHGVILSSGEQEITGLLCGINRGTVKDCHTSGKVDGKTSTGGLCGINASVGLIQNCENEAEVIGYYYSGGIAGKNYGQIISCRNSGKINNSNEWVTRDDELSTDLINEIVNNDVKIIKNGIDTGGIAGYSAGIVLQCNNAGSVGYPHSGYNVGGIVGRQCGKVESCTNEGIVYGKKDIGGIAGQSEPYINPDKQNSIISQVDHLNDMIDDTVADADDMNAAVRGSLNSLQSDLDAATTITDRLKDEQDNKKESVKESVHNPDELRSDAEELVKAKKEITPVSEQNRKDISDLSEILKRMTKTSKTLIDDTEHYSKELRKDLEQINQQINLISHMVDDFVNDISDEGAGYFFEDMSETSVDNAEFGLIAYCTNKGIVNADMNVSGISGQMGVDEEDPKGNVVSEIKKEVGGRYFYINIVKDCYNRGFVTSKSDRAGGICGDMTQGVVTHSHGYGSVESKEGSYIGGIAGYSQSAVRECYVLSTISGKNYVGGICGFGNKISDCYSMPTITYAEGRFGTIAGSISQDEETGELLLDQLKANYYVSDYYFGVDGVSYGNKAEAITYKELIAISDIPDEYRNLTVSFRTDEELLGSVKLKYGADLSGLEYPQIPAKDGFYGTWPEPSLDTLQGNLTIVAVYEPVITVVSSPETSEFEYKEKKGSLVERFLGLFKKAKEEEESKSIHLSEKANAYIDGVFDDTVILNAPVATKDEVSENGLPETEHRIYHVSVNLTDEELGKQNVRLRLFAPDDKYEVYLNENGKWNAVEFKERGTYADVKLQSCDAYYAVCKVAADHTKRNVLIGCAAGIVLLIVILAIVNGKKKKKKHTKD